ncbi:DNA excision repair protein ERCC-6-like [Pogona vitticeps]
MAEFADPAQAEQYRSYVSRGKQEAREGNLEESIRLFKQALEINSSEKLIKNIAKLEEALASLVLDQEEDDDFVDVCGSGLMLYKDMHEKLFQHQREGVAFLYRLYREGKKGGILADDMGLGKTIQVIAFLSGMFDAERVRSVLLIVPTTLVSNWVREFASWTPGLRTKVFHGTSKAERTRNLERIQTRNGVLVTTYNMLLNNWQHLASFRGKEFVWDYVILDEAHKIKSPSSKTTKAAHAILSKNRVLLTGTPVQNNLKELWALFDFACQGSLLGTSKTFKMEYENPITQARAKDATPGEKALGYKMSENLMSIIQPYFLRRSKEDLQKKALKSSLPENQSKGAAPAMPSLPRKNDFIVWVYLAPVQEEIYRKFLSLDHIKEVLMTTRSPLAELNILKKLCDHPRLLSTRACSQLGLEASGYNELDGSENEADARLSIDKNIEHVSDEILMKESGKLGFLVTLLERLQREGHRTLVFSQSRKMLDIIERILRRRCFKFMRIDGTVTHLTEREKRISVFQNNRDVSVFLLTTQVGGIGLTLTAATRVVIFDPSWNPAVDAQAVDRAYRIGQQENVVIYRLITCGTVEEKIYRRQIFKDALIRQTTGDKKNPYRYFTMQELRELFTLEDTRSSSTQLQLQSLHATQRKTDSRLDEHIAYLHSLDIFGLSDHDLMYAHETVHEDEAENEDAYRYIEHRVQKAQELVQLESQLKEQLLGNVQNSTEGAWLKEMESATQPKRKPQKAPQNHSLVPPASIEPTNAEVVNLVTEEDDNDYDEVINISSKITSLLIEDVAEEQILLDTSNLSRSSSRSLVVEDVAEEQMLQDASNLSRSPSKSLVVEDVADEQILQDVSNLSRSPFKKKGRRSSRLHAPKREGDPSNISPFPDAPSPDKENCSPESNVISHHPASQEADKDQMLWNKTNMEIPLCKDEGRESVDLQEYGQNQEVNTVESSHPVDSLSVEENCRSGSSGTSGDPPAEGISKPEDAQMVSFQQSFEYVSGDEKPQAQAEMSLDVPTTPHGKAREMNLLDAATSFQLQTHKMSEGSAVQKSGTDEKALGSEGFAAPLSFQADFNLILESSKEMLQDRSTKEMSLEEDIENEGFQLKLDMSMSHSWGGENRSGRSLQVSKSLGSVLADNSRASDGLMDNSETSFTYKKKPVRRIISDDEEEDESLLTERNESGRRRETSAMNPLNGNYMSTPKSERPLADLCFSPMVNSGKRRSIASRRSLANLVFDEVEDMVETVEYTHDLMNLESELTRGDSAQELMELEEELLDGESTSENSLSCAGSPGD